MKKIIILSLGLVLIASTAFAVGGNIQVTAQGQGSGQQIQVEVQSQTQNQGEEQNLMNQENTQTQNQNGQQNQVGNNNQEKTVTRATNATQLKQMVQERVQEMNQEMQQLSEGEQRVYQNQNRVRGAVHALLGMEDLVGGIGPQVSAIAKEFNNSVQATIQAEEKIQTRSAFARFFMGGDKKIAEELNQEVNQNRERIQELKQLYGDCNCASEVKTMLQEQIQNMEQEQNRLGELVQNEEKSNGIFGWIFQLFK